MNIMWTIWLLNGWHIDIFIWPIWNQSFLEMFILTINETIWQDVFRKNQSVSSLFTKWFWTLWRLKSARIVTKEGKRKHSIHWKEEDDQDELTFFNYTTHISSGFAYLINNVQITKIIVLLLMLCYLHILSILDSCQITWCLWYKGHTCAGKIDTNHTESDQSKVYTPCLSGILNFF